jgi:hypothetical protein
MDAPLAAGGEADVLDRVSEIDLLAAQAGSLQGPVEHRARGSHEGMAREILAGPGRLPDVRRGCCECGRGRKEVAGSPTGFGASAYRVSSVWGGRSLTGWRGPGFL